MSVADPALFGAVALLLAIVALLASAGPAWRAARVGWWLRGSGRRRRLFLGSGQLPPLQNGACRRHRRRRRSRDTRGCSVKYTVYAAVECIDSPHPVGAEAYRAFAHELEGLSPRFGGAIANELLPCVPQGIS